MDSILDFLVRQKKFALVFSLAFIAIGVLSVVGMQRDQFPAVDFEILAVTTAYPGASPEDVEKSVTNVIENELLSVGGIKEITSTSREGISSIIVTLQADLKDVTTVKNDVRNAVNRVKSYPEEVTDLPQLVDFNVTEFPIITINIDGANSDYALARRITDDLETALLKIKGVASIEKNGYSSVQLASIDGKKDVKKVQLVPLATFKEHKLNPHPGLQVDFDGKIGTVMRVSGGRVMVNFNHPLSGKEIIYEIVNISIAN